MKTSAHEAIPVVTPEAIKQFLHRETSWAFRRNYVFLLLGSLIITTSTLSLLATEPNLPHRTRVAFTVMGLIGLAWAGLATWVLSRRRPLMAVQRIWAGRLAIVASSLFTLGATTIHFASELTAWPAVLFGLLMIGVACILLDHGHREHRALLLLKASLEHDIRTAS